MARATIGYRPGDDATPVLFVETVWTEKELIKSIPGSRYDPNVGVGRWYLPLSWASLVTLRTVFGDAFTYDENVAMWAWEERNSRVDPSLQRRQATSPIEFDVDVIDERLHSFQRAGVHWMLWAESGLLGDEMGTGKTIQMLTYLRVLHEQKKSLPALVICPNSVKTNWYLEAGVWFPECTPYVIGGAQKQKRDLLHHAANDPTALVIINFESTRIHSRLASYGSIRLQTCRECSASRGQENLRVSACETHSKELNLIPFKSVIIDEAHRIKDPKSKQTRACWALAHGPMVTNRWAMTGTPLANHPGDTWSIMHAVAPQEWCTRSKFIDLFCVTDWNNHGGVDVVGVHPAHAQAFYSILDPRFRRMPKALVLEQLPPKIRTYRTVEMTPKQRRLYDQMDGMMMAWLEDGNLLTAASNLARRTRLIQLASSMATVEFEVPGDWTTSHVELCDPSPKIDALLEIIEDVGNKPIAVCAESRRLIELTAARLKREKINHALIVGGMSDWERSDVLRNFSAGKTRVLLFTIKAGGTGLTMTAADTLVRLQRSDSMVDNAQSEDRVHRIGSERHTSINIIDIVTSNTIEIRQLQNIGDKLRRLDEITRDRARLMAAGKSVNDLEAEESMILAMNMGSINE